MVVCVPGALDFRDRGCKPQVATDNDSLKT